MRRALAGPWGFSAALVAFVATTLALDRHAAAAPQVCLGVATWLFLLLACRDLEPVDRARVGAIVLVATAGEVLGSIVLGLYTYRLHNLPSFVPPGHGLVYLAGLQVSRSAVVRRHARTVVGAALALGAAWALAGVTLASRPDLAGALCMAALGYFLLRARVPVLYACMFVCVALLELYGTAVGTWRWAEVWPWFGLSSGNPPSGIAAGYCLFDAAALALGPRLLGLWRGGQVAAARPPRGLRSAAASPSEVEAGSSCAPQASSA
jgi:hypothetical protein